MLTGVTAYETAGGLTVYAVDYRGEVRHVLSPDEARLLGLKLIRLADKAEED